MDDSNIARDRVGTPSVSGPLFVWLAHEDPLATTTTPSGNATLARRAMNESETPVLVIVHGLGEHAGRYDRIARRLAGHGWTVVAEDLLGHGRQPGRRGDASYDELLDQVERVWRGAGEYGRPRAIWGHSFGGNLVLNTLLRRGRLAGLEGALVTGPMLRAALPIPAWKRWAARWVTPWFPKLLVPTDIDAEDLTHDARQVEAFRNDPLNLSVVSARLGKAMLESAQWALDHASQWNERTDRLPLTLWHGAEDRLTDCQASHEFARAAGEPAEFEP
ncbi:MAG: alpha/beta hydrolase [Pirellulaceae bacterium]